MGLSGSSDISPRRSAFSIDKRWMKMLEYFKSGMYVISHMWFHS